MKKFDFNISIEEFDSPYEMHEFSKEYQKEKERNMRNFKNKQKTNNRVTPILAAAAAILVASPFVVNATTNGEFFERVWGMLGRNDIPTHEEVYYEEEKDTSVVLSYPQQEFVNVDPSVAEELVGNSISHLNIVREVDGTTITILTAVRDSRAAIVEFTLEKEGGVDCLSYSQNDNETKGAYFSDDSTFYFSIGDVYGGKIYVDLERSTDECLYCYCYSSAQGSIWLEVNELPCTFGERSYYSQTDNEEELERIASEVETSRVNIPCDNLAESIDFTNADGGVISISAMSMSLDMDIGLGFDFAQAGEPYSIYSVEIEYSDGSTYLVEEHNNFVHTCDIEYANFSRAWADNHTLNYIFNRLVDTSDIVAIYVNGVEYTR